MPIDLSGKPIAITGASSGIGRATALACAAAGMPVAVAARREDRLRGVVEEITRAGGRAIAVACDVAKPEDCRRLVERTVTEFGSIYSVFANAGYGFEKPVHLTPESELREIFEVNFWGTLNTVRPALEVMLQNKAGHLLICSSCLSKVGVPYMAGYTATKAAQDHFGRAMRHELAGTGVYVSTVHPIGTTTELSGVVTAKSGGSRLWIIPERKRQSSETVAKAIVNCLRRPRGEVWTSTVERLAFALMVAFPGAADAILSRTVKRKLSAARSDNPAASSL